jgi:hypothetical protein
LVQLGAQGFGRLNQGARVGVEGGGGSVRGDGKEKDVEVGRCGGKGRRKTWRRVGEGGREEERSGGGSVRGEGKEKEVEDGR